MGSKKKSRYKSKNKNQNSMRSSSGLPSSEKQEESKQLLPEEEQKDLTTPQTPSSSECGVNQGENTTVMFFNDANGYIEHFESVLSQSQGNVRVNVVIKSQDNISSKKVPSNIFLYTGEVWWNIHKQREQSGYYKKVVNIDR